MTRDHDNYPFQAQHLFRTNDSVERHNNSIFFSSTAQKFQIKAVDSVVGNISDDMCMQILNMVSDDARKTMQLPSVLNILVDSRYELSCNINVSDGLANGAGGIVKRVSLVSRTSHASGIIWMHFDDKRIGIQTRSENRQLYSVHVDKQWTPIVPISRQFQVGRSKSNQVMRKQFPLRHSSAKTIHRSQGDTLDEVVLDFTTKRKEPHCHYVGLSRVKTLDRLFILNLNSDKIHVSEAVKSEMNELRGNRACSLTLQFPFDLRYSSCIKLAFHNVRSLYKHIDDVKHDISLMACDICVFAEARLLQSDIESSDRFVIPSFQLSLFEGIHSCDYPNRTPYGLAVYSKLPVLKSFKLLSMVPHSCHSECAVTQIRLSGGTTVNIISVYRRPGVSTSTLKTELQKIISQLNQSVSDEPNECHKTIIMGDFNVDWLKESTPSMMGDILPAYRQLITTVTTDYGSILDHVYTDIPPSSITAFTTESYYSDHKPIVCVLDDV